MFSKVIGGRVDRIGRSSVFLLFVLFFSYQSALPQSRGECSSADIDHSGVIDIIDIFAFIDQFGRPLADAPDSFDANRDGRFDIFDVIFSINCFVLSLNPQEEEPAPTSPPEPPADSDEGLPAHVTAFVDGRLTSPCVNNTYSRAERRCTGSDGPAFPTVQEAITSAQPGDTFVVREYTYRESGYDLGSRGTATASLDVEGTESQPITLQAYPEEQPIFEGRDFISNWHRCRTSSECPGFLNYHDLIFTDWTSPLLPNSTALYDGDTRLYLAQEPEPREGNSLYFDRPYEEWEPVRAQGFSVTTLQDQAYFESFQLPTWIGVELLINTGNNTTYTRTIEAFNSSSGTASFEQLTSPDNATWFLDPTQDRFAVRNHPQFLDTPGEYYFDSARSRLYYFPLNEQPELSFARRNYGFFVGATRHVIVDGLEFCGYRLHGIGNYSLSSRAMDAFGLIIRNSLFSEILDGAVNIYGSHLTAERNRIRKTSDEGIFFSNGTNNVIRSNELQDVAGTNLRLYASSDSEIVDNVIVGARGQHANGITTYLGCDHVLIQGNLVYDSNIPFTFKQSSNLTVRDNIFFSDAVAIAGWDKPEEDPESYGHVDIHHNTLIRWDNKMPITVADSFTDSRVDNNILVGGSPSLLRTPNSHNLFATVADLDELFPHHEDLDLSIDPSGEFSNACTMATDGSYVGAVPCD
ncbi:MAG: right-handed parallel beta-helix repeat-containing protein [Bdellovibrionales bacterium]|nr:right-handed parallel beta-helix repeat-containing protein [Bdellovibrionales bacterium]